MCCRPPAAPSSLDHRRRRSSGRCRDVALAAHGRPRFCGAGTTTRNRARAADHRTAASQTGAARWFSFRATCPLSRPKRCKTRQRHTSRRGGDRRDRHRRRTRTATAGSSATASRLHVLSRRRTPPRRNGRSRRSTRASTRSTSRACSTPCAASPPRTRSASTTCRTWSRSTARAAGGGNGDRGRTPTKSGASTAARNSRK